MQYLFALIIGIQKLEDAKLTYQRCIFMLSLLKI